MTAPDCARERVGEREQAPSQARGERQQRAVPMDSAEPQQMRHHQSDETDRAAQQHRRDRGHGRATEADRLQPRHRDAQRPRLVLAEQQHVERAGLREGERGAHGQREQGGSRIASGGEVAEQPEKHALHLGRGSEREQQPDDGAEARGERHADEQHAVRVPARAPERKREHAARRERRPGQGAQVQSGRGQAEQDRRERADRGAAGDAENVGIGERISEQHLQQRAGKREQRAAGESCERPRRAHAPDDLSRDLVAATEERVGELRAAQLDAAEGDRKRKARRHQQDDGGGNGLHARLMIGQPRASASPRSVSSGSTATGRVTRSNSGRSFRESL